MMKVIDIMSIISEALDITVEDIIGTESKRKYVEARFILYLICIDNGIKPQQLIWHISTERSRIYYGIRQAKILVSTDKKFIEKYNKVTSKIKEIEDATAESNTTKN